MSWLQEYFAVIMGFVRRHKRCRAVGIVQSPRHAPLASPCYCSAGAVLSCCCHTLPRYQSYHRGMAICFLCRKLTHKVVIPGSFNIQPCNKYTSHMHRLDGVLGNQGAEHSFFTHQHTVSRLYDNNPLFTWMKYFACKPDAT